MAIQPFRVVSASGKDQRRARDQDRAFDHSRSPR
jgi:hypothetical protein